MFNDIRVLLDKKRREFTYKVQDDKVIIFLNNLDGKILHIVYDENIYEEIILDKKLKKEKISDSKIQIDVLGLESLIFEVKINNKYLVKTIYKYINNRIDKNGLLEELDVFNKIYNKKEISALINEIDNKEIDELYFESDKEQERIEDILINNKLYLSIVDQMTKKDLMLLITYYIAVNRPPLIDQNTFDDLVCEAINSQNALENVWRLAMNYDEKGKDFSKIDDFFVNSKDGYYLGEYLSGVNQVNQEKIVSALIKQNDQEFIKRFLDENASYSHLEKKYLVLLEKNFKNGEI